MELRTGWVRAAFLNHQLQPQHIFRQQKESFRRQALHWFRRKNLRLSGTHEPLWLISGSYSARVRVALETNLRAHVTITSALHRQIPSLLQAALQSGLPGGAHLGKFLKSQYGCEYSAEPKFTCPTARTAILTPPLIARPPGALCIRRCPHLCFPSRRQALHGSHVCFTFLKKPRRIQIRQIKLTSKPSSPRPSLRSESISQSPEVKSWVEKYLGVGEWVMDQSVMIMGSSGFFERKR